MTYLVSGFSVDGVQVEEVLSKAGIKIYADSDSELLYIVSDKDKRVIAKLSVDAITVKAEEVVLVSVMLPEMVELERRMDYVYLV